MSEQRAIDGFRARFGREPDFVVAAPGRVNLIGEHTDYNGGFVMPAAISLRLTVAACLADGPTRLYSLERDSGRQFDADTVGVNRVRGWAGYPAGMMWALRAVGVQAPDVEAVVASDIPAGGGLSSSAAIELAFGALFDAMCESDLGLMGLCRLGMVCENDYVKLACGIMDQVACGLGRAGHAMLVDCRSLEIRYVPIPAGLRLVVCHTGTKRKLGHEYNIRRAQCEQAAASMGLSSLREASIELLETTDMPDLIRMRARHVLEENARVLSFARALEDGDLESIGALMLASHESLANLYEVSSPELDAMGMACRAASGCVGARLTGGGFGGACVSLVADDAVSQFVEQAGSAYREATGLAPAFWICDAADGTKVIGSPRFERTGDHS